MSRDFTKNVANYMTFANADASHFNAPITAFSMWGKIRTLDPGSPRNHLFALPNPGSGTTAWAVWVLSSPISLRITGRATATDSTRTATAVTTFTLGQWNHFAGQTDWANDTHYISTNGTVESFVTTGWTATAFDGGAGINGLFRIAQNSVPAASLTTIAATDGLLAHVAFWTPSTLL